jgi:hypothetical protein
MSMKALIFFILRKLERGKVKRRRRKGMKRLQYSGHPRGSIINHYPNPLISCVLST